MREAVCALNISVPVSECAGVLLPHVLEFYGEGSESTRELFVDLAEWWAARTRHPEPPSPT